MIQRKLLFIVSLAVCIYKNSAEPVPFISKCKSTDSACLKRSTQAAIPIFAGGLPEFKIESLDPLRIDKVDGSSSDLKLTSTNAVVTGLRNCIVENLDIENLTKLTTNILCDVTYKSQYEIHGRVLIVPFEGDGDLLVVLRKAHININADLGERSDKQGRKHWTIKNYKYTYELKGKSQIEMSGLFEGNDVLSSAAHQLISTSSNEVVLEVGPPILKAIVDRIIKAVNQFFRVVPLKDLILD